MLWYEFRDDDCSFVFALELAFAFSVGIARGVVMIFLKFRHTGCFAGAVAVGVVAKSGYDAYVNKKAAATINPSGYSSNPSQPVTHKKLYEPKISPPSTPTRNQTHNKSRSGIQ